MKWSLLELRKFQDQTIEIDTNYQLETALMERENEILGLSDVKVNGFLLPKKEEFILHYKAQYTITLPSSRSLEPVELSMEIDVDEVFMTKETFKSLPLEEQTEEILFIEGQTISLEESVEDNILLNIPLKVLSKEEEENEDYQSGNSWKVISEEEYLANQTKTEEVTDPRFAKLSDLFSEKEE